MFCVFGVKGASKVKLYGLFSRLAVARTVQRMSPLYT